MERHPPLRLARLLFAALAAVTLAGQILEVEQAAELPQMAMALREARVISIQSGGAPERAGLARGDEILAVGGVALSRGRDALSLLKGLRPGVETTLSVLRAGERLELAYRPDPPDRLDILWRFAVGGVGIVTLLIGAIVFLKNPRPLTLLFGALCLAFGYLVHPPFVPPATGWLVARKALLVAATCCLPSLLVHFFLAFPLRHPWLERHARSVGLLYAPGFALCVPALASLLGAPAARGAEALALPLNAGATLLWVVGVGAAATLFVQAYRHARTRTARRKVRVILWGTMLGTLPVALMLGLRALWPGFTFPGDRLAVLAIILVPLSFGYAIVRHGIFDLTLIVRRSLAFSLLAALLGSLYLVLQTALGGWLPELAAGSPLWLSFLSLSIVGLLLLPAYRGLLRLLEQRDGAGRRAREESIYEFGRALRGLLERGPLVRLISDSIAEGLGARQLAYFERSPRGELCASYLCGVPAAGVGRWRLSGVLAGRLQRLSGPLDRGDLDTELPFGYLAAADQEVLDALDAHLLVPLRAGPELKGCLLVGGPAYADSYTAEDRRLAEVLAAEGGMALENALLHERALEEERLRRDVDLARDLQERLLPTRLPQLDSLEVTGFSIPCQGVGGDYYDCFLTPRGELLLAIGDVSGKGVPGAILMANLQGLVRVEGMRDEPPPRIVERINRQICDMEKPERFVTFCLARVDPASGQVAYCNAGHPGPLLVRAEGAIEELQTGGLPLGIGRLAAYEGAPARLRSGDLLLLYTDGITERERPSGEQFGRERLLALARSGRRLSVRALQETILGEVREFAATPLDDDTTLLLVKML